MFQSWLFQIFCSFSLQPQDVIVATVVMYSLGQAEKDFLPLDHLPDRSTVCLVLADTVDTLTRSASPNVLLSAPQLAWRWL